MRRGGIFWDSVDVIGVFLVALVWEVGVKKREFRIGYMDYTDFNYELGHALGGNIVYSDKADLLESNPCAKECGIVKVRITLDRFVSRPDRKPGTPIKDFEKPAYQIKRMRGHISELKLHTGQLLLRVDSHKERIRQLEKQIEELRAKGRK